VTSWVLHCRELAREVDGEQVFETLFKASRWAFWLDSSLVDGPARYSLLGDAGGPHGDVLQARVTDRGPGTVFDTLERRLAMRTVRVPDGLPAALACGYVGYFGYELKAYDGVPGSHAAPLPDATWISATRFVVIDHRAGRTWVCELAGAAEPPRWIDGALAPLRGLPYAGPPTTDLSAFLIAVRGDAASRGGVGVPGPWRRPRTLAGPAAGPLPRGCRNLS